VKNKTHRLSSVIKKPHSLTAKKDVINLITHLSMTIKGSGTKKLRKILSYKKKLSRKPGICLHSHTILYNHASEYISICSSVHSVLLHFGCSSTASQCPLMQVSTEHWDSDSCRGNTELQG
jgi:hypothetical protein